MTSTLTAPSVEPDMSTARTSRRTAESGSVLPLIALALVTLMTCAALAIDLGSLTVSNRWLQGVADLAAIAGATELKGMACNAANYKEGTETTATSAFNHVRTAVVANLTKNSFPVAGTRRSWSRSGLSPTQPARPPSLPSIPAP